DLASPSWSSTPTPLNHQSTNISSVLRCSNHQSPSFFLALRVRRSSSPFVSRVVPYPSCASFLLADLVFVVAGLVFKRYHQIYEMQKFD
ncbi:hypothetical protein PIB30_106534, partial [Stylosanthes scabra]|nr:hypothetical protein [Stylosanthes scabra]